MPAQQVTLAHPRRNAAGVVFWVLFWLWAGVVATGQSRGKSSRATPADGAVQAQRADFFSTFSPAPIAPVDEPKFLPAVDADKAAMLVPDEPVIGITLGGEPRAYSIWQLERRLVVNDRLAGRPTAVTWDPFSHTMAVFYREVNGKEITLQADGRLYKGALVMKDRETGSTWTQQDGAAIDGPNAGARLQPVAAVQTTWKVWKQEQPRTVVLDKGGEKITSSAYADYDADSSKMGVGGVELTEPRFGGKALVIGVLSGNDRVVVPLSKLEEKLVVALGLDRQSLAALFDPATRTVRVVRTEARGHKVTLVRGPLTDLYGRPTPPYLVDEETASRWDLTGKSFSGRMEGHRLPVVPYRVQYWYAWQAFFPKSRVE